MQHKKDTSVAYKTDTRIKIIFKIINNDTFPPIGTTLVALVEALLKRNIIPYTVR